MPLPTVKALATWPAAKLAFLLVMVEPSKFPALKLFIPFFSPFNVSTYP